MNQIEVRQSAQVLIAAHVQASPDLDRLVDEVAQDHPEEMLFCLAAFVHEHTSKVNSQLVDVRGILHYVIDTTLTGLREIGLLRGGDPHEFLRMHLQAFSEDEDAHVKTAQLLMAARSTDTLAAAYETLLDRCTPAWGRVCDAALDVWLTASLDALDTCSPQPLLRFLLRAVHQVLQALANYSGVGVEQMMEAYWTDLIALDCAS